MCSSSATKRRGWAIVNSGGEIVFWGHTRREAIKRLVGPDPGYSERWSRWYRRWGARCVRASVVVEESK